MNRFYDQGGIIVYHGKAENILPTLADASVDAVVTDPPYSLEFMGRAWDRHDSPIDFQRWCEVWGRECLRILKPGGHLLAFGGTRTYHRLVCGLEDAGFEVRDSIHWIYGSGFPKSLDVSKAIDKVRDWTLVERLSDEIKRARAESGMSLAEIGQVTLVATDGTYGKWYHRGGHMFFETGRSLPSRPEWEQLRHVLPITPAFDAVYEEAERSVIQERTMTQGGGTSLQMRMGEVREVRADITAPATEAAKQWQGWGTALKPAHEPIVVARKPLSGTVAANVLEHGTGALHIDACRIEHASVADLAASKAKNPGRTDTVTSEVYGAGRPQQSVNESGRWPANVALDEDAAAEMDQQSGTTPSNARRNKGTGLGYHGADGERGAWSGSDDAGGASRFFPVFRYEAKADTSERPLVVNGVAHETVKPLALMRWLVRLVTQPGGVVLDPFAGSGTTAEACLLEGFSCVAVEREADYLPLIKQRLDRRRDPAAYLESRGEVEGTIFDLLGEETA